jgi:hypothetical protein
VLAFSASAVLTRDSGSTAAGTLPETVEDSLTQGSGLSDRLKRRQERFLREHLDRLRGVLLVGTGSGVYRSTDGGLTFGANAPDFNDRIPVLTGSISDLDVDTVDPSRVYASALRGGIFVSTDGGETFPAASNLFTATNGGPAAFSYWFIAFAQSTEPDTSRLRRDRVACGARR